MCKSTDMFNANCALYTHLNVLLSKIEMFGNLLPVLHVGKLIFQELFLQVEKLFRRENCPGLFRDTPFSGIRRTPLGNGHPIGQQWVAIFKGTTQWLCIWSRQMKI